MSERAGQNALVTGGASGIGLAVVQLFLQQGARVAVNYLPGDLKAAATVADLAESGAAVVPAPGDVSDRANVDEMVFRAIETLGGLDVLINNAGTAGDAHRFPSMISTPSRTHSGTRFYRPISWAPSGARAVRRSRCVRRTAA